MLLGPFSDLPELDEIAHRMFRQFARMEYALKAAGYLKREDGRAEANWSAFAADIDEGLRNAFIEDAEVFAAVAYIGLKPPKKQMVRKGALYWRETPPEATTASGVLLMYVSRVRNNLFHGGKFSNGWLDPERSRNLLRHCLTILDCCLRLSDRVRDAFEH
ncbi:hypothetical protein [Sphingosinicella sp. YJ22]|uniref:hypothetical protein n=1 Tax=Sphingosinicella sp. YJ22 TaxID=1104780 RepID=UPI001A9C3DF6|nr:hypothetical protein [Sphingosinicella sp. YJ22]